MSVNDKYVVSFMVDVRLAGTDQKEEHTVSVEVYARSAQDAAWAVESKLIDLVDGKFETIKYEYDY